jgi:hypothetical protein
MKMAHQAAVGASLAGCVDFDKFTAVRRKDPCPVLVSHPDVALNKYSRGLRIRYLPGESARCGGEATGKSDWIQNDLNEAIT